MFDRIILDVGTRRRSPRKALRQRRGMHVLAMLALLTCGSLAAAMAVVSEANLKAADSHLKVNRAMSAADTGLNFAVRRLDQTGKRFVIAKGEIDGVPDGGGGDGYAYQLWTGTYDVNEYDVIVNPPPPLFEGGYDENQLPDGGIREALLNASAYDVVGGHAVGDVQNLPYIDGDGVLYAPWIALNRDSNGPIEDGPRFQLRYWLHPTEPYIIVQSEGVDGHIHRRIEMWFRMVKKIEFAVLSPNRIMIGSNVRIEGPLGSRYGTEPGELDSANGDPLVMRSDFYSMDDALDLELDKFFDPDDATPYGLPEGDGPIPGSGLPYDEDSDNQLRLNHAWEQTAIHPDLTDYDGDEYVSDWDVFLEFYDADNDKMVIYDSTLSGLAGLPTTEEFDGVDDQLGRLIDLAFPDRNDDGIIEGCDVGGLQLDCRLGYADGALDRRDGYAKVRGRLLFAISRDAWESNPEQNASYQTVVHGPIRPGLDKSAVEFLAPPDELRELTTDMFLDSQNAFFGYAQDNFAAQVAAQEGDPMENGGCGTANYGASGNSGQPEWVDPFQFPPGDPDPTIPYYEDTPRDAPGAYDHYLRPRYCNMVFQDVIIPMGNNGLFEDCYFLGSTFIETEPDCGHVDWNYMGALDQVVTPDPPGPDIISYEAKYPQLDEPIIHAVHGPIMDTKPYSNNIMFDNCTFIGSVSGTATFEYAHWRNKVQFAGNTRFYIDPTDPDLENQPDKDYIIDKLTSGVIPADHIKEFRKSSILMPGWSADLGNFNNDQAADPLDTPRVKLKGVIVAGIMDIRGTADVHGTLLMTFRPEDLNGPLTYGGMTDAFNTTIGYFGSDSGDGEGSDIKGGEITIRYDPVGISPDGVLWFTTIEPDPLTYVEGVQQ